MATTPAYNWPLPDPTDPPNIPQHLGDLARAQEAIVKGIDTRTSPLPDRITRAEGAFRGNFKYVNFDPTRVVTGTTMSELALIAQPLTVPQLIPMYATHYLLNLVLNVTTYSHQDLRLGAKLNGVELGYFDQRPLNVPADGTDLVHAIYSVDLSTVTPGTDYALTYWARNGGTAAKTDIHTGRAWAYLV